MKKWILYMLICLTLILPGCGAKEPEPQDISVPGAQIAYAAYQYDQEYQLAEGWQYEMELTAGAQLQELENLMKSASFRVLDQVFEYGRGYRLVFRAADGSVERDILLLDDGHASIEGMLYDAEGTEPLLRWLDNLKLDEQEVE